MLDYDAVMQDENLDSLIFAHLGERRNRNPKLDNTKKVSAFHRMIGSFIKDGKFGFRLSFSIYPTITGYLYYFYRRLYRGVVVHMVIRFIFYAVLFLILERFLEPLGDYIYELYEFLDADIQANISKGELKYAVIAIFMLLAVLISEIILCVPMAFSAKYFYVKKFLNDLYMAGYGELDFAEVEANMRRLGGRNDWAQITGMIYAGLFMLILLVLTVFMSYIYFNM